MPRAKTSAGYPPSFKTIMEHVTRAGTAFKFPIGFNSYTAAGLRTTFQAFLKCIVEEARHAPHDADKQELAQQATRCIVRIRDGQVCVEDRWNDPLENELAALLKDRGIKSDWETSLERLNRQVESPAPPAPELVEPDPELAPTCTCGGYGCPECEPPAEPVTPPPEPQDSVAERNKKLTDLWLGKGKS